MNVLNCWNILHVRDLWNLWIFVDFSVFFWFGNMFLMFGNLVNLRILLLFLNSWIFLNFGVFEIFGIFGIFGYFFVWGRFGIFLLTYWIFGFSESLDFWNLWNFWNLFNIIICSKHRPNLRKTCSNTQSNHSQLIHSNIIKIYSKSIQNRLKSY